MGRRLRPDGRIAGAIRAVLAAYYRFSGGVLYVPIQFTLFSRIPKRIVWPAAAVGFVSLFAIVVGGEVLNRGDLAYSANAVLPSRGGARSVVADHFETTRDPDSWVPYIQSDIVTGPYVRLVVPLVPLQYADRLAGVCPDLEPVASEGLFSFSAADPPPDAATEERLLACFGAIWSLSLDGEAIAPAWDFLWSARRGPAALLAYLPTEGLAPGAHVLRIERMPRPPEGDAAPAVEAGGARSRADAPSTDRPAIYLIRFRI